MTAAPRLRQACMDDARLLFEWVNSAESLAGERRGPFRSPGSGDGLSNLNPSGFISGDQECRS